MPEQRWTITFAKQVTRKDIPALGNTVKLRIQKAVSQKLGQQPLHFGKPLQGSWSGLYSLRVGDYRVIYQVLQPDKTVRIMRIGHRREVYDE